MDTEWCVQNKATKSKLAIFRNTSEWKPRNGFLASSSPSQEPVAILNDALDTFKPALSTIVLADSKIVEKLEFSVIIEISISQKNRWSICASESCLVLYNREGALKMACWAKYCLYILVPGHWPYTIPIINNMFLESSMEQLSSAIRQSHSVHKARKPSSAFPQMVF